MRSVDAFANSVVDDCPSTNQLARELARRGYPGGTWVSAHRQNAGRGRHGKEWIGSAGNLYLSYLVRPIALGTASVHWIPLLGAMAITEFLVRRYPRLQLRIKWPNDLMGLESPSSPSKKLGGLLCESIAHTDPNKSAVVVGIGLNCQEIPPGLHPQATSLSALLGQKVMADELRSALLIALERRLRRFFSPRGGVSELRDHYARFALFSPGDPITWGENQGGVILGLGENATLRVQPPEGPPIELYADEIQGVRPNRLGAAAVPPG